MPSPSGLLRVFTDAGIEFIVVGGVAAVLNGAAVNTFDTDMVHARDPENIGRILSVLETINGIFRMQPDRRLRPNASHLAGRGHLNLVTTMGPLDLLCTIGRGLAFEDLLPHTTSMELGGGAAVKVLNLETLIGLKEELNGDKDRIALPFLRQALKLKQANEASKSQD